MTMPNLFENSAVRRLLESLSTQNAPAQGAPQVPPQAPAQGPTAGMLAPPDVPRETPPSPLGQVPTDDAHTHQSGIRGGLLHLLGADRMAPETAALLTPEQEARAKPGLLRSIAGLPFLQTPRMVQEARADQMLARGEQGRAMRTREAVERQRQEILAEAGPMPQDEEGQRAWIDRMARIAAALPVPDEDFATSVRLAANQLREREFAPQRETWTARPANVGGQDVQLQFSNTGQWRWPDGRMLSPQEMASMKPVVPPTPLTFLPSVGPEGTPTYTGVQTRGDDVTPVATGIERPLPVPMRNEVNTLRDDFANDPTVKTAKAYASAFQGVQAAAAENNPQANLALMYEAVKMRDPNAVREGELALQRAARSVPGWLYGLWDKASKGNLLTATEREQIVRWARVKIDEQERLVRPIQAIFGDRARRMGFAGDSAFIAPDPFAGASRSTTTPPITGLPATATPAPTRPTGPSRPPGFTPP